MKLLVFLACSCAVAVINCRQLSAKEDQLIQENYVLTNGDALLYLVFFIPLFYMLFYPSDFTMGLGLTIENLFSSYLGNPDPDVVHYHCRRIVVNRAALCASPFVFFVFLFMTAEHAVVFRYPTERILNVFADLSFPLLLAGVAYWAFHHITDFQHLTTIRKLQHYSSNLLDLNRRIATEMLNLETFKHNISSSSMIIVTQSWIVYYSKFAFTILRVDDVTFHVTEAEEIIINPMNPEGAVQLLTIKIVTPSHLGDDIVFKMHNLNLLDLQNAIVSRINIPSCITLKLSTVDRFSKVFAEEAAKNPPYYIDSNDEVDLCLACSEVKSNIKLVKRCFDYPEEEGERCHPCACRPMWCALCMGKVFAAKQDKVRSGQWLSGKAPCPTCRATFCVLDVAMIKVLN